MKDRFDTLFNGLNIGILAPMLGFYLIFLLDNSLMNRQQSLDVFIKFNSGLDKLPKIMALSIFISALPVFFGFIWLEMAHAAKGVLGATFFYGFVIIILVITHWITTS